MPDCGLRYGKLINNHLEVSAIYNSGERCILNKTIFKNNSSNEKNCSDIINKTTLYIQNPKFETDLKGGILWGGNLASIVSLFGSENYLPSEDIILFISEFRNSNVKIK